MASARVSESFILRTYPLREADLIVSYFTRDLGKRRGVAKRARKPASRFGGGLERLSYVRMHYFHRENRELDTLDGCESVQSGFSMTSDYDVSVALDFIAETSEHLLPAAEPNERYFRLLLALTGYLQNGGREALWPAVAYFTLWSVKLSGILGPLPMTQQEEELAGEILSTPLAKLSPRQWTRQTASGLRRSLVGLIEEHVERRLITVQYLETLD